MAIQLNPLAIPTFLSSILTLCLAGLGWKRRDRLGGREFLVMMLGGLMWTLGAGLDSITREAAWKTFWISLQLWGIGLGQVGFVGLVLVIIGKSEWATPRVLCLVGFEPTAIALLALTNRWHHLYWNRLDIVDYSGLNYASVQPGFFYKFDVICACIFNGACTFLLLRHIGSLRGVYRAQVLSLLASIILLWGLDIVELFVWSPIPNLDTRATNYLSTLAFPVVGLILMRSLRFDRFLDMLPVAYDVVIEGIGDAVIVLDPDGRVVEINLAGLTLLDCAADGRRLIGRHATEVLAAWPEFAARVSASEGGAWILQTIVHSPTDAGSEPTKCLDARSWPLVRRSQNVGRVIGIRDTTEQWKLERALSVALEQAEQATRAKSQFLAHMSHEIRTPLAAILGYTDILMDDESQPERLETLRSIRGNGSHLLKVINNILDLAKVEAQKLDIDLIPYSPWRSMLEAESTLRVQADMKDVLLEIEPIGRIPERALFDPKHFLQILTNLGSNAIKFTPGGKHVWLRLGAERPGPTDEVVLKVEVQDEGIGMTTEQAALVFEPFVQAESGHSRRFGGTGLGLTISKQLAEAMSGEIHVQSEPGRGSLFTVTIVCRTPETDTPWNLIDVEADRRGAARDLEQKPQPVHRLKGCILLAEDNPHNRHILLHYLHLGGLDVEVAEDGEIAIEKALAKRYHAILMDIQLPRTDGYSATRQLRRARYDGPIIALTAHAMREERDRCLEAGCTDYLTKPVDRHTLLETLARYVPAETDSLLPEVALGNNNASTDRETHEHESEEMAEDEAFRSMLGEYLDSLPATVEQMNLELAQGDTSKVASLAHQLRGSGGMFGLPELSQAAEAILTSVRNAEGEEMLKSRVEAFGVVVATTLDRQPSAPLN